ncbi:hypothetical protein OC846_004579 [Tilletia horrida]|uniref:Uncharacterized protein n=1 Tax=Tilletia horrida TaxID=155126 RepID=A0AAN6GQD7_9BASI|nr:hypothetical protein OC846_004579 [Tilletia horrida]KAK0568956.1 hypothetical protein OC861_001393 [Tilletia horrida]
MSDSSLSTVASPTFDQLNFLLISRGYTQKPLILPSGTSDTTIQALSSVIHSLLAQRDEDIELREQLSAQTRTHGATIERLKRAIDEEMRKSEDMERKCEAMKSKAETAVAAHNNTLIAHKSTQADLLRTRAELQSIKVAAHQQRLAINRSSERLKSKLAETSLTALRSVVPSLRVATGAFSEYTGVRGAMQQVQMSGSSAVGATDGALPGGVVLAEQLKELEEERANLLQSTDVLKRMTTEAVNALRAVDRRLCVIEQADRAQATPAPSASSTSTSKLKRTAQDAFGMDASEGLIAVGHEQLFPRAHPLRAAPVLSFIASTSNGRAAGLGSSTNARSSSFQDDSGKSSLRSTSQRKSAPSSSDQERNHPAAVALQESIHSLFRRLDDIEGRQNAAAAAARAAERAAKRARTIKTPVGGSAEKRPARVAAQTAQMSPLGVASRITQPTAGQPATSSLVETTKPPVSQTPTLRKPSGPLRASLLRKTGTRG